MSICLSCIHRNVCDIKKDMDEFKNVMNLTSEMNHLSERNSRLKIGVYCQNYLNEDRYYNIPRQSIQNNILSIPDIPFIPRMI